MDLKDGTDVQDAAGNIALAYSGGSTVTIDRTRTWTGGGGDANWTTAANWEGNVAPAAGDGLIFAGNTQTANNNNFLAGTTFDSITFANDGFILAGNSITLSSIGGVAIDNVLGQNRIELPITTGSTGTMIVDAGILQLGARRPGPRVQRQRRRHPKRHARVGLWRQGPRGGHPELADNQLRGHEWRSLQRRTVSEFDCR